MSDVEALVGFKNLAEDDSKYTSLLNDSACLHGLCLLLSNSNREVVTTVLQILLTLSKRPNGTFILSNILGLAEQLTSLLNQPTAQVVAEDAISTLAKDVHKRVFVTRDSRPTKKENPGRVTPTFNSQPKAVALKLYGVQNNDDLEAVRHALIGIRGVISITFQLHKNRAIVFTVPDLNPETLVQAVQSVSYFHSDALASKDCTVSEADQPIRKEISAKIIRRRNEAHRNHSRRRVSRRESLPATKMPVYLEENADLFEVDESRAAPKLKTYTCVENGAKGDGPVSWLSNFLERSFFW